MFFFAARLVFRSCGFLLQKGEENRVNERFMREKPVLPLLLSMALPMVLSMLVNSLYNIIDSLFVAKLGEDAITALSLVFPVQNLINALAIGFGVGINAVISYHLGAGERDKADAAAVRGVACSVLHGIVCTAAGIAVMPWFLRLFTDAENVVSLGVEYADMAFLFAAALMAQLAFEKIYQAMGCMKATMLAVVSGCVTNIVLDPLLIFGIGPFPRMGMRGAALATGIGQTVPLAGYLVLYSIRPAAVRLRKSGLTGMPGLTGRLYAVGIPAALNLALPSLLVSCLNALLAGSQAYVVVLGIYYKLQTFLYMPASGIIQGMRPVIGYNYGAGERERVHRIFRVTLALCACIMAVGTVLCLLFAAPLMGLFTENAQTIAIGAHALRVICIGFVVSAVSVAASGALEGLGRGTASLVISLCRYTVVILPAAVVLCRLLGADGVWHAFWVTEIVSAGVSLAAWTRSCD